VTTKDLLEKARELISDPARWTKGAVARDLNGEPIEEFSSDAVCFCSIGVVSSVANCLGLFNSTTHLLDRCAGKRGYPNILSFNDAPTTTHEDIVSLFQEAINDAS